MRQAIVAAAAAILLASASHAQTFDDVPPTYWAYDFIETLAANGITGGCGNANFCPGAPVTRAQMAVFLERGMRGSGFVPPAAKGNVFLDVSSQAFAASFIEQLYLDGITAGCGGNNYCPASPVTRDQMAVFLLRAKRGAGYIPPPAVGLFADVPLSYWAVHWIEQLSRDGITSGCGNDNYCPRAEVTRAQMAVFLVRAFGLERPGTLTLYRKNSDFFDPGFDQVSWPFSGASSVATSIIPKPPTYTLDTFRLDAEHQPFTVINVSAVDSTGTVNPVFSGLSDGQIIPAGQQLTFSLLSPLTNGATVQLRFSFEILETGDSFVSQYSFSSN